MPNLKIEGDPRVVDYVRRHRDNLQSKIEGVLSNGRSARIPIPVTTAGTLTPDRAYEPVFIAIDKAGPDSIFVLCTNPAALPDAPPDSIPIDQLNASNDD